MRTIKYLIAVLCISLIPYFTASASVNYPMLYVKGAHGVYALSEMACPGVDQEKTPSNRLFIFDSMLKISREGCFAFNAESGIIMVVWENGTLELLPITAVIHVK